LAVEVQHDSNRKVPNMLKFIAILGIVFGVLGLFGVLMGAAGLIFGGLLEDVMISVSKNGAGDPAQNIQTDLLLLINGVGKKYEPIFAVIIALAALESLGLLMGGIKTLSLKPSGRKLLLATFAFACFLTVFRGGMQVMLGTENLNAVEAFFSRILDQPDDEIGIPRKQVLIQATIQRYSLTAGLIVGLVWAIFLAIYYLFSLFYLQRDDIRVLFQPPDTSVQS